MILFASEPQVNLRNHLPPGDSFFSRVNVLDFSLEPRTELRKQLARRGFLFGLIVVIFIPEPQVNLRNHLPPGDLFFSSLHTGKIPLFAIVGAARYSHAPNKKFFLQKESPWPARVRMSAQRSLWPALIAKSVIGFWLVNALADKELMAEVFMDLFGMIITGKLKPVIGSTYPLSKASDAHRDMLARKTVGKIVLDPAN